MRIDRAVKPVEIPVRPDQPDENRDPTRNDIGGQRQAAEQEQHEGVEVQRHHEVVIEEIAALVEMQEGQHQRIDRQQEEHHRRCPALHRRHQRGAIAVDDAINPDHQGLTDFQRQIANAGCVHHHPVCHINRPFGRLFLGVAIDFRQQGATKLQLHLLAPRLALLGPSLWRQVGVCQGFCLGKSGFGNCGDSLAVDLRHALRGEVLVEC